MGLHSFVSMYKKYFRRLVSTATAITGSLHVHRLQTDMITKAFCFDVTGTMGWIYFHLVLIDMIVACHENCHQ